jgi:hypothetical protein
MNRDEFTKKSFQMISSMAPHVASRKTANMLRAATEELMRECRWKKDVQGRGNYDTQCGNTWTFVDGGISENLVEYCPYCGGIVFET